MRGCFKPARLSSCYLSWMETCPPRGTIQRQPEGPSGFLPGCYRRCLPEGPSRGRVYRGSLSPPFSARPFSIAAMMHTVISGGRDISLSTSSITRPLLSFAHSSLRVPQGAPALFASR